MQSNSYSFFDENPNSKMSNKFSINGRWVLITWISLTTILSIFFILEITAPKCQTCISRWFTHEKLPNQQPTCTTPGCIEAAADLLKSIDCTKNPCQNFYEFACGTWLKNSRIPDDQPSVNIFDKAIVDIETKFRTMFEESDSVQINSSAIKYAFNIYQKCMNTSALRSLKATPLLAYLDNIGGWPIIKPNRLPYNTDFTDLMIRTFTKMSITPLLNFYITSNATNVTNNVIIFFPLILPLGSRYFYLNDTLYAKEIRAYKKFMRDVTKSLANDSPQQPRLDEKILNDDMEKIFDFERKVAKIMKPKDQSRNATLQYNKRTLRNFSDSLSFFNITRFLMKVLPNEIFQRQIKGREKTYEVVVTEPEFYKEYQKILISTDKRTLINYIGWFIVKSSIDRLDSRYEDIEQDFEYVFKGRLQKPARWKVCVNMATSLDKATGSLYVRQHFSPDDKMSVNRIIKNVKESFKDILNENDWMDQETKVFALEKLEYIAELTAYPNYAFNDTALDEHYKNLTINQNDSFFKTMEKISKWNHNRNLFNLLKHQNRKDFYVDPAQVNAYYAPGRNAMILPAGIFQRPFFHSTYPEYINYGGIGSVIGHELTHGFDDKGRQADKVGNLANWWTKNAQEKFKNRAKCIVNQYGNFTVKEVNIKVNGNLTQGENIADNGGVKQAFRAYQKFVSERGSPEPILPGMNLTGERLFFASFAHTYCGKMKPETQTLFLLIGAHSPDIFRVNGPLSNLEAFSKVYNCPIGSPMNPTEKCSVW